MKVKIVCSKDKYELYKNKLEIACFTITDDANLLFIDLEYESQNLLVKKNGDIYQIHITDIFLIESFGHEIVIHLEKDYFTSNDRLYHLEMALEDFSFVRINKSQIINTKKIKKMSPLLNYKIKVTFCNNEIVYVTRGYYQLFKDNMGI